MRQSAIQKHILHWFENRFASILPWLVLVILLVYTYVKFVVVPYPGFFFRGSNGYIETLYVTGQPGTSLEIGDKLVQVGPVPWQDYRTNLRTTLFKGVRPGEVVPITVERNGQNLTIPWVYPGARRAEVASRLWSEWWLAFVFWGYGTLTILFLRPKNSLWRLLVAACYLIAIWLITGSVSKWVVWNSAIVMRMVTWLCLPVYWHLHWVFPKPLGRVPAWDLGLFYLGAAALAIAEWFRLLPLSAYSIGFLLAMAGSLALLVAHAVAQPAQRRELARMAFFLGLAILPAIVLSGAVFTGEYERSALLALLGLPAIPLAYLYVAYRRRLGVWELRANRAITLLIYVILLLVLASLIMLAANAWLIDRGALLTGGLIVALAAGLASIAVYPRFQRWAEHRLLGVPLPPTHLPGIYASRITTSLDQASLVRLLKDEVLPSLQIRQSALLRCEEDRQAGVVYASGVETGELPQDCADPGLQAAGVYRPPLEPEEAGQAFAWVRLALPLMLGERPVGVWLLGRRDPDDYYAQAEISILQTLADQTVVALTNILQAERLHALYQMDIEREENERKRLALELHDDVLGQMALLRLSIGEGEVPAQFDQAYQSATSHVRGIINTLRPTMLNYGLRAALDELADEAAEVTGADVPIEVDVPASAARYPATVELHLYRILQQACENALKHARAKAIRIAGRLDTDAVELTVEDNGAGFAAGQSLDLVGLLANQHYGLAGMFERAALIGAQLKIDSVPERGTRVHIAWCH